MSSHTERHVQGMLGPQSQEEVTIHVLFTELVTLADRYKNDQTALAPVVMLAEALMRLAGDQPTGRIDPTLLNKQVRDTLMRAGVDTSDL